MQETVNNRIGSQMHLFTPTQAQALLINQLTTPPVWLNKDVAINTNFFAKEAFEQVKTCLRNIQMMVLPLPVGTNESGHYMLFVCFNFLISCYLLNN